MAIFLLECENITISRSTGHLIRLSIEDPNLDGLFRDLLITKYCAKYVPPLDIYTKEQLQDALDKQSLRSEEGA